MAHIAIIGGGLAGLTAALRLAGRHRVTMYEASERAGGQIWTERTDGFVVERGAEGFVARSTAVPHLAEAVHLDHDLIGQAETTSYGYDGSLRALEPGEAARFLGFQVPADDLGKGIRTFRHGMGSLIEALAARVGEEATLHLGTRIETVTAGSGGVHLHLSESTVDADAVIVATTSANAAQLLAPLLHEAAQPLATARTLSSVTVELAYDRRSVHHPLAGTGIVVAEAHQRHGLRACAFTSSKFEARSPGGRVALRLFFRPEPADLVGLDPDGWRRRGEEALERLLGITEAPERAWISRWPDALPVFGDGFRAGVAAVEESLAPFPVALAGAAFHGPGIDAAVQSGERAAARWL